VEDLVHGGPPRDPAREESLIRTAVGRIEEKLRVGDGVVVHCAGGTGRTGTVIGCVLRRLGLSGHEVSEYLRTLNVARGKTRGWPESPWQRALVERF
jgi:protein-tyrosine phosphatase